jgi:hypothetical protein
MISNCREDDMDGDVTALEGKLSKAREVGDRELEGNALLNMGLVLHNLCDFKPPPGKGDTW